MERQHPPSLKRIEGGEQVGTSILAISQVCGYLRWRGRPHSSPRVLYRARIDWSLWNDLAITIQMKRLRVDEIHSNDTDFDRIPGVKRIFKWLKPKHA
ncbi:MAG: hypothetical protein ACUVUB_05310 [Candidatus Bathyarchaeia archaeon]